MRRFFMIAFLLIFAASAFAINPQEPGAAKFVAGGSVEVVPFGPFASETTGPSAYTLWSTDAQPVWVRLYIPRAYNYGGFEETAWRVPQGYTEACPVAVDTLDGFYTFIEINANSVATTDTVIIKPYFGGVGK